MQHCNIGMRRAKSGATRAHNQVFSAIQSGDLPRLDGSISCEDCGQPAVEYDHRNYKRPLDVHPVCRKCNKRRGRGAHRGVSSSNGVLRTNLTREQIREIKIQAAKHDTSVARLLTSVIVESLGLDGGGTGNGKRTRIRKR
jgi:hypothetical protein